MRVVADGGVVGRALDAVVKLFGQIVHAHEAVGQKISQRVVRAQKIRFAMRPKPGMVQIGNHAPAGLMKGFDDRSVVVGIGIQASEIS